MSKVTNIQKQLDQKKAELKALQEAARNAKQKETAKSKPRFQVYENKKGEQRLQYNPEDGTMPLFFSKEKAEEIVRHAKSGALEKAIRDLLG